MAGGDSNTTPDMGNSRSEPLRGFTPATYLCPACRLPMHAVGRLVSATDDAGLPFVFKICRRCNDRLNGLPFLLQKRAMERAIGPLASHPERYEIASFETVAQANLYCALAAENP
jgi:hypothetical protein